MRSSTVAVANALQAENVIAVVFVELDFASGFLRVNSAVSSFTIGGNVYTGVGNLGKISQIDESTELQAYGMRLELSGIPSGLVATALGENYQGRAARILVGVLNADHTLIADPVVVFAGRMDNMHIALGPETASIAISVESRLIDWDRSRVRRYNNADQQAEYPGDLGLEFAEQMVNKTLFWGKVSSI